MGQVRNDTGETRVLPALDYAGWEPGRVLEIPDADVYHYVAGGFTALTKYPVPARLHPNHAHDPLAFALPEPDEDDPSAIAVGPTQPAVSSPPAPSAPSATTGPTTTAASATSSAVATTDAEEAQA